MLLALASLAIGVVIGYLGQRYYLCFISPLITLYMRVRYEVETSLADFDALLGVIAGAAVAFLLLLATGIGDAALPTGAETLGCSSPHRNASFRPRDL